MRLVHTSDWHLGQRLFDLPRDEEHQRFLRFLLTVLQKQQADVLVIAGDVFDSANPPAEAQRAYYNFLADCKKLLPLLTIVVIGGNHDSPARLDAPAELLRAARIHVVGALPTGDSGSGLDLDRLLIPLPRADGQVGGWLVAVPYLRPVDLPSLPAGDLPEATAPALSGELDEATRQALVEERESAALLQGLHELYARLFAVARLRMQPGQALLAAAHCYLADCKSTPDSERKIQLGNKLPLPVTLFPEDVAYVALGHLHLAQTVAGKQHVRYCGSPIPLSLSEDVYPQQVLMVQLDGEQLTSVEAVPVPRAVAMLRLPAQPLPQVLQALQALPPRGTDPEALRPYLEVNVLVAPGETQLDLRRQVEDALKPAEARLLKLTVVHAEGESGLQAHGLVTPTTSLRELDPEEVLLRCYRRAMGSAEAVLPAELQALFARLLEEVKGGSSLSGAGDVL